MLFKGQLQSGGTEIFHPSLSNLDNGDFHSALREDESTDFTIAGHKFRFAKDFFFKKMHEKLDKIEHVKNLCKEDEGTKDDLIMEMHNAGFGSSPCLNKGNVIS